MIALRYASVVSNIRVVLYNKIDNLTNCFRCHSEKLCFSEYSTLTLWEFSGDHSSVYGIMVMVNLLEWEGSCIMFVEDILIRIKNFMTALAA